MANAGYSGTPLRDKLGFRNGMKVRLIGPPAGYWAIVDIDPAEGEVTELAQQSRQPADLIHIFATDENALRSAFARARKTMTTQGMVWASWPKKTSAIASTIGRSEVMAAGKKAGLVDVKVCAIDDDWSGLKFVIPVKDRS